MSEWSEDYRRGYIHGKSKGIKKGLKLRKDYVRVVRCKDCSHSDVCKMDDGDVRYCHIFEMQTEDDYYCADGERKDDE